MKIKLFDKTATIDDKGQISGDELLVVVMRYLLHRITPADGIVEIALASKLKENISSIEIIELNPNKHNTTRDVVY